MAYQPNLDLLQRLGYYSAGGKDPGQRSIDKINAIFGGVSNIGKTLMDYATVREAMKKSELERQKLEQENTPLVNIVGGQTPLQTQTNINRLMKQPIPVQDLISGKLDTTQQGLEDIASSVRQGQDIYDKYGTANVEQAGKIAATRYYEPKTALTEAQTIKALREPVEKIPVSLRKAVENGYDINTIRDLFPEVTSDEELRNKVIGEVQMRAGMQKQETGALRQFEFSKALKEFENSLPTAEQKNKSQIASQMLNGVGKLEGLLNQIPEKFSGAWESLLGKTGMVYEQAGTYDRLKKAFGAGMYRAATGDTRLSDQDAAERAYPLIPQPWYSYEQRKMLLDYDKALMNEIASGKEVTLDYALANAPNFNRPETPNRVPKRGIPGGGNPKELSNKMVTMELNGKEYAIPESKVGEFIKDNKGAKTKGTYGR